MQIDGRIVKKVNCNICENSNTTNLWNKDGFNYVICSECELVFVNPRLTSKEISNIYEIGFKSKNENKSPPVDHKGYSSFFKTADKYRKNNNFLDVGCFRGDLLSGAKNKKWNVFGTEISEHAAKEGKVLYDIDIFVGSLLESNFEDNFFDVVTMFDVIEHLTDPSSYLQEISRILRPSGLLYLDTPNFNSINRYILGKNWSVFFPWHLYYFKTKSLKKILEKNNLFPKTIRVDEWGPMSRNNVYKNLNKHKSIVKIKENKIKSFLIKYRKQIKPFYLFFKKISNYPLRLFSFFGLKIGSKITLIAEKN